MNGAQKSPARIGELASGGRRSRGRLLGRARQESARSGLVAPPVGRWRRSPLELRTVVLSQYEAGIDCQQADGGQKERCQDEIDQSDAISVERAELLRRLLGNHGGFLEPDERHEHVVDVLEAAVLGGY